jgi:hypothetical protein
MILNSNHKFPQGFISLQHYLFIYSTLDAIYGKQAKRSSSPLGQLFNHGCESFTTTLLTLGFCQAAWLEIFYIF